MYVVAGATGNTGSVAAETLLSKGKQVTVIVRSAEKGEPWRAKGAKVAVAGLDDTLKMREILAGAEGAYLLIPPSYQLANYIEDRRRLIDALAAAVGASQVPQVVLMSSSGGHLPSGAGMILVNHMGEEAIKPGGAKLDHFAARRLCGKLGTGAERGESEWRAAHVSFAAAQVDDDCDRGCRPFRRRSASQSRARKADSESGGPRGVQP